MKPSIIIMVLVTSILVFGCSGSSHLTADRLASAVYQMEDVGAVTFTNGSHYPQTSSAEGVSFTRFALVDLTAFGDLNDDGNEDAVTFIARYGLNGEIILTLEALLNNNGIPAHTASYLLGDRIAIDHISIVNGHIYLTIITQGPGDQICCPTLRVNKVLRLQNGKLIP